MDAYKLITGDCLDVLQTIDSDSIDACVTDPPYGLSFMGKAWDEGVPSAEVWCEVLRVLKPGGHLLAFAGTRTQHRMASAIEDAGFEVRDMIAWVYGSGFPKSLDVSKAIDKAAGAEREVVGKNPNSRPNCAGNVTRAMAAPITVQPITAPATPEAQQWQGWGTAVKPALEPITVARKPLTGTVAANVLEWGTGAINVDGCRVECEGKPVFVNGVDRNRTRSSYDTGGSNRTGEISTQGRFPANLIHDGSDEVVRLFPVSDSGSAARFFYCAKASKRDRDEGCEGIPLPGRDVRRDGGAQHTKGVQLARNHHPTVKPTDLMRYLVRLVTPPGGTVLDPYTGSGSTGKACMYEGFGFIGIELDLDYIDIAKARIQFALDNPCDDTGQHELFGLD